MKNPVFFLPFFCFLALAGCAGWFEKSPAQPDEPLVVSSFEGLSPSPPPAPVFEERLPNPEPLHQIWRPGYWSYNGARFDWVPGSYMPKPNPTAAWSPDRWEKRQFGWAFVPGFWQ